VPSANEPVFEVSVEQGCSENADMIIVNHRKYE